MIKMAEFEGIDAPAGPLTIVSFLSVVSKMVMWGMIGVSAQNAMEVWCMRVWTGFPSR